MRAGRHRARAASRWARWLLIGAALLLLLVGVIELGGFAWLIGHL